jgi:hypothetical protein
VSSYDDDARDMTSYGGDGAGASSGAGNGDAATGAAVAQFIDDLRSLAEAPPPAPNAELAAVLEGAPVPRAARPVSGRKRVVVAVAASVLVAGTGVAAANGRLPQPAQRLVSDVVDNLTPFSLPSAPRSDEPSVPGTTPPDDRVVVPPVVPAHRGHPQPRGSESEPSDSESAGGGPGGSEPSESESGSPGSSTAEQRDGGGSDSGTRDSGTQDSGTQDSGSHDGGSD